MVVGVDSDARLRYGFTLDGGPLRRLRVYVCTFLIHAFDSTFALPLPVTSYGSLLDFTLQLVTGYTPVCYGYCPDVVTQIPRFIVAVAQTLRFGRWWC